VRSRPLSQPFIAGCAGRRPLWIGYIRACPENKDWRGFPRIPPREFSAFPPRSQCPDLLERRYPLLWVAGEISNFTVAKSGHAYFVLKDEHAQVRCVMFRQRHELLDWQARDGMQIEAQALVSLYEPRGDFQLNVETMRRAGLGALFEAFLKLRDKLDKEGLFKAERNEPCLRCRGRSA